MTAFEEKTPGRFQQPLLLPSTFRWRDPGTKLVHQGAVVQWQDGKVLGYTLLCTEVLGARWEQPPTDEDSFVSCLECLGAREQDE
jgi:hypothetical protein